MKCIGCGKNSTKQDRGLSGGRCSACHQVFVTDPLEDGLSDMAIKLAEETVCTHGRFYFLKDNLKYQLHRKLNTALGWCTLAIGSLVIIFLTLLVFAILKGDLLIKLAEIVGLLLFLPILVRVKYNNSIKKLDALVDKWVSVNPHEKLLTTEKFQASLGGKTNNKDESAFKKLLICEHNDTAELLLSNLFHLHYACRVMSGANYPDEKGTELLQQLKKNPDLQVFLLHDYSPSGQAFARRIRTDAKWFGNQHNVTIIDLGLNAGQKKLFQAMSIKQVGRNKKITETAEVALFRPATLIELCGAAINEGVPFDLITSPINNQV